MNILDDIQATLSEIELSDNVRIIFACESGSRAWGFPSADSDYDVRFLYVRPLDWYLSIDLEKRRDVIDRPISDLLDVSGWDLRKTLQLLHASNATLLEWLQSPIVYRERTGIASVLRAAAADLFSPKAAFHHYLSMVRNNVRRHAGRGSISHKDYFYILRPLLACRWIMTCDEPVPMEFGTLADRLISDPALLIEIETLLQRKRGGMEMDTTEPIPILQEFIVREHEAAEAAAPTIGVGRHDLRRMNEIFRRGVEEAWGLPEMSIG